MVSVLSGKLDFWQGIAVPVLNPDIPGEADVSEYVDVLVPAAVLSYTTIAVLTIIILDFIGVEVRITLMYLMVRADISCCISPQSYFVLTDISM